MTGERVTDDRAKFRDCMDWYSSGYAAGIDRGLQIAADEQHGRGAVSAAIARMIASTPSYAELADRRGDHTRAAAQRALLLERGI